ncbi:MAG: hypothetical protein ACYTKD_05210 [Planctomycetota bacterium]|jgi:hypothetical protein
MQEPGQSESAAEARSFRRKRAYDVILLVLAGVLFGGAVGLTLWAILAHDDWKMALVLPGAAGVGFLGIVALGNLRARVVVDDEGLKRTTIIEALTVRWPTLLAVRKDAVSDDETVVVGAEASLSFWPKCYEEGERLQAEIMARAAGGATGAGPAGDAAEEGGDAAAGPPPPPWRGGPVCSPAEAVDRVREASPEASPRRISSRLREAARGVRRADVRTFLAAEAPPHERDAAEARLVAAFEEARALERGRGGEGALSWKAPRIPVRMAVADLAKAGARGASRLVALALILCLVIGAVAGYFVPDLEVPWGKVAAASAVLFGLLALTIVLEGAFGKTKYTLGQEGVTRESDSKKTVFAWADMVGFRLDEDRGFTYMVFHMRNGGTRMVLLPRGEEAEGIVRAVAERVPRLDRPPESEGPDVVVGESTGYVLLALTIVYALGVGYLLAAHGGQYTLLAAVVLTFVAGPGTIGCVILYGRKLFRRGNVHSMRLQATAFGYNFLGMGLVVLFAAIIRAGLHGY